MRTETREGVETRTGTVAGTGTEVETKRERGWRGKVGRRRALVSATSERSRVKDQGLPFRTRHNLCRQKVVPAGSQQLRAQDPVPF